MLALPAGFRGVAPDQRGFGGAEREKIIDGSRGLGDLSDDLAALMDVLNIKRAHVVGHSTGGGALWRFLMNYPGRALTCTLVAPVSPYGFGGTKDADGTPTYSDFAGSGAGTIKHPEYPELIKAGERGTEHPFAPRNVMNAFCWKPPFVPARAEDYLSAILSTHVGENVYPGDMKTSGNWPHVATGRWGVINALSPAYAGDISALYRISPKPPILWVRGADDLVVSDNSLLEIGALGAAGRLPDYPGTNVYPPQPMDAQIRRVLENYGKNGGEFHEYLVNDSGHSPYIEKPEEFNAAFHDWLKKA